ncbi:hypothetical protein F511_43153 [Dorcoceras hygrometricum]|uniref:Uncharacterized protein n=1 Tax=Dorcoceras hygrometricum TaxID=472368 RepID=A0A2Z7ALU0_9LAMI|nr:hypothetical protein F511_43153 [Dorcoceras hygrometricum]
MARDPPAVPPPGPTGPTEPSLAQTMSQMVRPRGYKHTSVSRARGVIEPPSNSVKSLDIDALLPRFGPP